MGKSVLPEISSDILPGDFKQFRYTKKVCLYAKIEEVTGVKFNVIWWLYKPGIEELNASWREENSCDVRGEQ